MQFKKLKKKYLDDNYLDSLLCNLNVQSDSHSVSQQEIFYEEQKQLGLFFSPTCPVCFEQNVILPLHLNKIHDWSKHDARRFVGVVNSNWKCDQCVDKKFYYSFTFESHLRSKHDLTVEDAKSYAEKYYNEKKLGKLNSLQTIFLV